jgi:serine/threonine protein kinase
MEHLPDITALHTALPSVINLDYLDSGTFKAVYRGGFADGPDEAIKAAYLPPTTDDDVSDRPQLETRLQRELNALRTCPSQFIVRLGRLYPTIVNVGGNDYLVYSEELLSGRPLRAFIGDRPLPEFARLKSLMLCLLDVIHNLWNAGYVHRDIKPENIIVTDNPTRPFVILDLGIALHVHGTPLTMPGGWIGTPLYMAPEAIRVDYHDHMDFRSDLYSAGMTVFEYACGIHPLRHNADDVYTTFYRVVHQQVPKLELSRGDLPISFCRILDRCLHKSAYLRHNDVSALTHELEATI